MNENGVVTTQMSPPALPGGEETPEEGLRGTALKASRRDLAGGVCEEWTWGPNFLSGRVS